MPGLDALHIVFKSVILPTGIVKLSCKYSFVGLYQFSGTPLY